MPPSDAPAAISNDALNDAPDDATSPPWRVTVLPAGQAFEARADETLLAAALRAATPLRSSCRNGTCRTCMCRLEDGAIAYTIEWPGLSAEEKREGWVLPCVAQPRSDVVLLTT